MKILLIADDDALISLLTRSLGSQHHIVDAVKDGEMGWTYASTFDYNLIILDLLLPKLDGISLCKKLRTADYSVPILILTAQDQTTAKVRGLDAGADDYVVKPFDINELIARVRALLRRGSTSPLPLLSWGDLMLNPSTCDVTYNGQPLTLTTKEYDLLELFLRDSYHVFSNDEIIDRLWSSDDFPSEATVRSHLRRLRHKLQATGAPADLISTMHGRGYYLKSSSANVIKEENPANNISLLSPIQITIPKEMPDTLVQPFVDHLAINEGVLLLIDLSPSLALAFAAMAKQQHCQVVTLSSSAATISTDTTAEHQIAESYLSKVSANEMLLPTVILVGLVDEAAISGDNLWCNKAEQLELIRSIHQRFPHWSILVLSKSEQLNERLTIVQNGGKFLNIKALSSQQIFTSAISLWRSATDPIKVLVVDYDVDWLRTLPQLLQPWEIKVSTLADSPQFWTFLQLVQPDALLLDGQMPDISSLELCQILRSDLRWQHLPILILSADQDPKSQHQAFLAGADDYLVKPILDSELAQRIRHRLARLRA
jgi:DNA-binding response OmpR family regulator